MTNDASVVQAGFDCIISFNLFDGYDWCAFIIQRYRVTALQCLQWAYCI